MKRLILPVALIVGLCSFKSTEAQVRVNASINIGGGYPAWIPAGSAYAENYYFPDLDMYYDMGGHQYWYLNAGRWICAPVLPAIYANIDMYRARRVVIHDARPYLRPDYWRSYYGGRRYVPAPVHYRPMPAPRNVAYRDNHSYHDYRDNGRRFDNGRPGRDGRGYDMGGRGGHGGSRGNDRMHK